MPIDPVVRAVPSIGSKIAGTIDPDGSKRRNLLEKATDLLSTGNYAAAGFFAGVLDAIDDNDDQALDIISKPLEGFGRGASAGFTGENPIRYGDVLRKAGAPEKVSSIGGLVGDILLDPLNFVSFFSPTKLGKAASLYTALKKSGTLDDAIKAGGEIAEIVGKYGSREEADKALTLGSSWLDKYNKSQMALAVLERPTRAGGKLPFFSVGDIGHVMAGTRPGQYVMKSSVGPAFKAVGDALKYVPIGWKTTPFRSSEAILPRLQGGVIRHTGEILRSLREDVPIVSDVTQSIGKALNQYFKPKEIESPYGWGVYSNIGRKWSDILSMRNANGDEVIRELALDKEGPMLALSKFLERNGVDPNSTEVRFLREHAAKLLTPEDQMNVMRAIQRPFHTNMPDDIDRTIVRVFGGLTPHDVRSFDDVDPSRFEYAKKDLAQAISDHEDALRIAEVGEQPMIEGKLANLRKRYEITFGEVPPGADREIYNLIEHDPEEFDRAMWQTLESLKSKKMSLEGQFSRLTGWYKSQKSAGTVAPAALKEYVQKIQAIRNDIKNVDLSIAAYNDLGDRVSKVRLSEADLAKERFEAAKREASKLKTHHILQGVKAGALQQYADEADHLAAILTRKGNEYGHEASVVSAEYARRIAEEPLVKRAERLSNGDPEEEVALLRKYISEAAAAKRIARNESMRSQVAELTQAGVMEQASKGRLVSLGAEHPENGKAILARERDGMWASTRVRDDGSRIMLKYGSLDSAIEDMIKKGYVFDPSASRVLPPDVHLSNRLPPITRERAHREINQVARRHHGKNGPRIAQAMRRLVDAEAAAWAAKNSDKAMTIDDFYAMRLAGFTTKDIDMGSPSKYFSSKGGVEGVPMADVWRSDVKAPPSGAVSLLHDGRKWAHILNDANPVTWSKAAFNLFRDRLDPSIVGRYGDAAMQDMFNRYLMHGKSDYPDVQEAFDEFGSLLRRVTKGGQDVPESVRTEFDNIFHEMTVDASSIKDFDIPPSIQPMIRRSYTEYGGVNIPKTNLDSMESILGQYERNRRIIEETGPDINRVMYDRLKRHEEEILAELSGAANSWELFRETAKSRSNSERLYSKKAALLLEKARRLIGTGIEWPAGQAWSPVLRFSTLSRPTLVPESGYVPLLPKGKLSAETRRKNLRLPLDRRPLSIDNQLSNEEILREGETGASHITMLRRMAQDPETGAVDAEFLQKMLTERFEQSPPLRRAVAEELGSDLIRLTPDQHHRAVAIETLLHTLLKSEASRGMIAGFVQKYFPRYMTDKENGQWIFKRGLRMPKKTYEHNRGIKWGSIDELNDYLEAVGLPAMYDERLAEVLGMRVKDHNAAITQHDFLKEVVGELGFEIDRKKARSAQFFSHEIMGKMGMSKESIEEARALAENLSNWGVNSTASAALIGKQIENAYRGSTVKGGVRIKMHIADRIDPMRIQAALQADDKKTLVKEVNDILALADRKTLDSAVKSLQEDIIRTVKRYNEITPKVGIYSSRLSFAGSDINDENFIDALNVMSGTPFKPGNHLVPLTPDQMKSALALKDRSVFVLPVAIADDINKRIANHFKMDGALENQLVHIYDKIIKMWKDFTLVLFPQFHTRNLVSNVVNSTMSGGLDDFEWYEIMGRYQSGEEIEFVDKIGRVWDRKKLTQAFEENNILGSYMGDPEKISGKIETGVNPIIIGRKIATTAEDNARGALMLDGLNRGLSPQEASLRTKKHLFDYEDLSDFERKYLKRFMPFYTWTRKNIPLQIEQLVTRPIRYAKPVTVAPSIEEAVSGEEMSDRDRAALPKFIRDGVPIRHKINPDGTQELFLLGNWLPLNDLLRVSDPGAMAYGMFTPMKGFWEAYVQNWNPFFENEVERYPGETQDILGIRIGVKERHILRNIRMLNELDKAVKTPTVRGRVAQVLLGRSYTIDIEKARDQRLREFRAEITRLRNAMNKEDRKDKSKPVAIDLGRSSESYRKEINRLKEKVEEVR